MHARLLCPRSHGGWRRLFHPTPDSFEADTAFHIHDVKELTSAQESLAQGGDPGFADDCVPLASAQSTAELETAN